MSYRQSRDQHKPRVGRDGKPLDVLVVDDSALVRQVMTGVLSQEPDIQVTVAADPIIAMNKMKQKRPDVIVLDLEMPRMDGLTFLRKIMAEDAIPVVVCSGHVGPGTDAALQALEAGAVEIVAKSRVGVRAFLHESAVILIDAVRGAAQARLRRREQVIRAAEQRLTADAIVPSTKRRRRPLSSQKIVAVGASTGGTEALHELLEAMPVDAPGMVIVQHMPEGFTAAFAQRLNQRCRIEVREAGDGDQVVAGRALIAPGDRHTLLVQRGNRYRVRIADGALVSRHRPSVDVLLRSVAQAAGPNAVGVILTGMGEDGATGLLEMKEAGAATIVQNEATCVVFGMPKGAIARDAADEVLPLHEIAPAILKRARSTEKPSRQGRPS